MLSITKLQNLKAIHNGTYAVITAAMVVINHKTTKFESNSQRTFRDIIITSCCYQSQNYKIWKQFTTMAQRIVKRRLLLSITKLQNLKAIHNNTLPQSLSFVVVINHKTTKFESNSQLEDRLKLSVISCYQSQNYKIWKQFTTWFTSFWITSLLLSITKLQNLKAIHNDGYM